jgi:hypothetical protein
MAFLALGTIFFNKPKLYQIDQIINPTNIISLL